MKDPTYELKQLIEKTSAIVEKYRPEHANVLKQELSDQFANTRLNVMLYGAYNAGKSTLINVLLGTEKAIVNDIPTTDRVDSYPWNDICLLDTPGVNAPIKHENITEEQVQRSGLMLFVIREGDQDTKDLYDRLFDMLRRGKEAFIVLNHQATGEEDRQKAYQKIISILISLGPKNGISDERISRIPIYPVNLNTALRGRLKNSDKLLEHSGYTEFINGFEQWMERYNQESEKIAILQNVVYDRWLSPAYREIERRTVHSGDASLREMQDARLILEKEKTLITNSAFNFTQQEISQRKGDIRVAIENARNQSEAESNLQTVFTRISANVQDWLQQELDRVPGKVSAALQTDLPFGQESTHGDVMLDLAFDGSKKILSDKDNVLQLLKFGRSLKIPGLKGRWEKTLGKWAGKAAVVVQFASSAYEIYKAGRDEEKHNQAIRQQTISLNQYIEQICSEVLHQIHESVKEILDMTFATRIASVQQEIDKMVSHQDELHKDMEVLSHAISMCRPLK